jgi:hypothetical protein
MLRDGTLLHIPRAERDKHTLLQHVEELMDMVDFCKIEELSFNGVAWNLRVSKPAYLTVRNFVSFWAKECNAGVLSDPEQAQDALEMLVAVTMKKLQRPTSLKEHIAEFTHTMSKPREWQLQIIHSWVIWPNHLLQNVLQLGHAYRQQDRCEDALVMYASAIMHASDVNPKQAFIGNIHGFVPSMGGRVINAESMVSIAHMMASGQIAPNFGKVLNLCNAALAIDCRMLSPVYYVRAVVYANGNAQINMQMCANVIIPNLFQKMSMEGLSSQAGKALLCYELSLWPDEQTLALMRCVKSQAAKFPPGICRLPGRVQQDVAAEHACREDVREALRRSAAHDGGGRHPDGPFHCTGENARVHAAPRTFAGDCADVDQAFQGVGQAGETGSQRCARSGRVEAVSVFADQGDQPMHPLQQGVPRASQVLALQGHHQDLLLLQGVPAAALGRAPQGVLRVPQAEGSKIKNTFPLSRAVCNVVSRMSTLQSMIDPLPIGHMRVDFSLLESILDDLLDVNMPALALAVGAVSWCVAVIALFERRDRLGSWTRVWTECTKRIAPSYATSLRP